MAPDFESDEWMSHADSDVLMAPLVARVKPFLWARLLMAIPCLATAAGIGFSLSTPESLPWVGIPLAVVLGVMGLTAFNAQCRVTVMPKGVRLSYWILFRTYLPAAVIASIDAAEWDTWSYGGYGIKGRPRSDKGLLLNASYDASGRADRGLLITTVDGRSYRIEASEPVKFAEQSRMILGTTPRNRPPSVGETK